MQCIIIHEQKTASHRCDHRVSLARCRRHCVVWQVKSANSVRMIFHEWDALCAILGCLRFCGLIMAIYIPTGGGTQSAPPVLYVCVTVCASLLLRRACAARSGRAVSRVCVFEREIVTYLLV